MLVVRLPNRLESLGATASAMIAERNTPPVSMEICLAVNPQKKVLK